jgi:hypothetical protein
MSAFALWVDQIIHDGSSLVAGEALTRNSARSGFSYSGSVCFLSSKRRLIRDSLVYSVHVGQVQRACWRIEPMPSLGLPYLVTDERDVKELYGGPIVFHIAPEYERLLPNRGSITIPVAAKSWVGLVFVERRGLPQAVAGSRLIAWSAVPQASVTSGEVYAWEGSTRIIGSIEI